MHRATFPIVGTLALLVFQSLELRAADLFITPEGAGVRDGTSWENALDASSFAAAVNERTQPGDRLLIGGGTYSNFELTIRAGGAAGRPKMLEGVDRGAGLPVFANVWNVAKPAAGRTGLRIEANVSHVTFKALRFRGYAFCVHAPHVEAGAGRSGLVFDDVDMEQCRHGFYLSDCDNLQLTGCDLKRYTKHGFRFDQGCDGVTVRACTADCSEGDAQWETKTELLPFGFVITDSGAPSTRLVFEDCVARNNLMPLQQKKYKNGDGFVVEGINRDVTFRRCRSIRNQDGGYDLKVPDVRLDGCVAIGNKRNFRIWTTGTLTNCIALGGETSLWSRGGPVTAVRCTFHAAQHIAVLCEAEAPGPVVLRDCIVSCAPGATNFIASVHRTETNGTAICGPKERGPDFTRPDPAWDGVGDAMNSRAFPGKGYVAPFAGSGG